MPTPFFSTIPFVQYDMLDDNNLRATVNILQRVKIRDVIKTEMLEMYEYSVKDGERIEDIAHRYYGWTGYHWIVLLANDIINPYTDWPLSYEDFIAYIRAQYTTPQQDGLIYTYQTLHHYEDIHGVQIDYDTFVRTPVNERKRVTLYDFLVAENDAKRNIRLIDKKHTPMLEDQLIRLMKENKLV
jgi:hypothetical protein